MASDDTPPPEEIQALIDRLGRARLRMAEHSVATPDEMDEAIAGIARILRYALRKVMEDERREREARTS